MVGWILQDLEHNWHVFHGMKLAGNWDIDHVVVGPGGLYSISTKSWRGLIDCAADGRLTYNNEPSDLIKEAVGQAMQLRDRLQAVLGGDVPFVQAVVAVPFAFIKCPSRQGAAIIVHQDGLLPALEDSGTKLKSSQITRCVKVLEILYQSAADVHQPEDDANRQPLTGPSARAR